jgi:hypothetical protein
VRFCVQGHLHAAGERHPQRAVRTHTVRVLSMLCVGACDRVTESE